MSLANEIAVPPLLPEIFSRWFASRGWTPRAHQLELLSRARDGRSVLLIAPTGGGKTLAGFLPTLVELYERGAKPKRMVATGRELRRSEGLHTLYISPLKALAVDIARNLETPIAEMELPIKVETRTGDTPVSRRQRHLGDGTLEVARDIDRERLERRDVERVQAAGALQTAAGGDHRFRRSFGRRTQLHQRRQKSRQRLAGAGGRDQQRGPVLARLLQQRQLMRARQPTASGEPRLEAVGQQRGRLGRNFADAGRHGITGKPWGRVRRGVWASAVS